MSLRAKPFIFGTPVLIAVGTFLLLWLLMGGVSGGANDNVGIKGFVEYSVFDANGNLKAHSAFPNVDVAVIHNAARQRLGVVADLGAALDTDGEVNALTTVAGLTTALEETLFDNVQACTVDTSGGLCTATGALTTNTDGNPADGSESAGGDGVYTTVHTFTASATAVIQELQLTSGTGTDTTQEVAGAWQDVNITLESTDTLQVTWTITVS